MDDVEAYSLVRRIVNADLNSQQFKTKEDAERAASAYTIVLKRSYIAKQDGYKWVVRPERERWNRISSSSKGGV